MVQRETKITCEYHSICFMAIVGFHLRLLCAEAICAMRLALPCPGQAKLGQDHPQTLTCLNYLAGLLQAQGHLEEAEPFLREALEKSPGAQLQGFRRDFWQWILSHTLLDFRWVLRFFMTRTGAATLLGWFCIQFLIPKKRSFQSMSWRTPWKLQSLLASVIGFCLVLAGRTVLR